MVIQLNLVVRLDQALVTMVSTLLLINFWCATVILHFVMILADSLNGPRP